MAVAFHCHEFKSTLIQCPARLFSSPFLVFLWYVGAPLFTGHPVSLAGSGIIACCSFCEQIAVELQWWLSMRLQQKSALAWNFLATIKGKQFSVEKKCQKKTNFYKFFGTGSATGSPQPVSKGRFPLLHWGVDTSAAEQAMHRPATHSPRCRGKMSYWKTSACSQHHWGEQRYSEQCSLKLKQGESEEQSLAGLFF